MDYFWDLLAAASTAPFTIRVLFLGCPRFVERGINILMCQRIQS
jgi:hypothetical protein